MVRFKSPVQNTGDGQNVGLRKYMSVNEALKSPEMFISFLSKNYQGYNLNNGVKELGEIIDDCPACRGLGTTGNINTDAEACPICLVGKLKNKTLGIPFYFGKLVCGFLTECPIKDKSQKQAKCHQCKCKFD